MDKAGWRRWAREHRPDDVDPAPFVDGLARVLRDQVAGWVLTYRPMAHEVDLGALEGSAGIGPFALTRTPDGGRHLTVHPAGSPVERHRWGFEQPRPDAPQLDPSQVAAVLVPGLAFDRTGHRIGHGLGYYDRLLARLAPGAVRIGVVPAALVVEQLPAGDHDIAMTHLATERGVAACPLRST
jgi:5-formyltetrahydrofolate cyclo-ligase